MTRGSVKTLFAVPGVIRAREVDASLRGLHGKILL